MAEEKSLFSKAETGQGLPEKDHSEFLELKERLAKLEARLEKEQSFEQREKEVRREIKKYVQEVQQTPSFAAPTNVRDEVKEISRFEPNQQVGALISLVFEKSLAEALSVANNLDNPAILDEFHDVLVDRYYKALIEEGILKQL